MADDQLSPSGEPDAFLDYLLRCAVAAPGGETSATAGRMLARLLVACAVEGNHELITPYLVPMPGEGATFEVRTYQPGDRVPTQLRGGLRADVALKLAVRSAHDSDEAVEVVSRTRSGLERRILVRPRSGDLEFRFPGPQTLSGPPVACVTASNAWSATIAAWRSVVPADGSHNRGEDRSRATPPLTNAALADPLSAAIREAIGDLVVEVDLSQVETLIRRALDAERRETAEPLAERVSTRLLESLALRDTAALAKAVVDAVALAVPDPAQLAQAIAADVGGVLARTPPQSAGDAVGAGVEGWRFSIGMEQLQLRLDALQDQLHKSAELLQAMGDRMATADRNAALAERLATAADQERQQLAKRIEEQLSALSARRSGDEAETPDDVARLTRKLRQSVAQFDRAVARMDAMLERADGRADSPPVTPLMLAGGASSPPPGRTARPSGPVAPR